MIECWTTRSGPRIRYLDNAPVEAVGLPVLFSPGLTDFADEYLELLECFLPRRVLVVEVRGRGRSDAPASGYSAADHAADLDAVVRDAGIGRFHLMTFSRGTTWALQLAIDDPTRVVSLAIGDYIAGEVALPHDFTTTQMRTRFRGRPLSERVARHVVDELVSESRGRELWNELADLSCPLLVARPGSGGGLVTDQVVDRYRRARPDVEVVVVPDATHDLFRVDRTFYPKAVADFIARRCPGE